MTSPAAHERLRELARAEVARNARPATSEQAALVQSLLAPAVAQAAGRNERTGNAA